METLKVSSANLRHVWQNCLANQNDLRLRKPLGSMKELFAYAERLEARYLSASERVARFTPSLPVLHGFAGLAKAFRGELVGQGAGYVASALQGTAHPNWVKVLINAKREL
jgi:hypothetical protein